MSDVESESTDVVAASAGLDGGTSLLVVDSPQGQLDSGGTIAAPEVDATPAWSAAQLRASYASAGCVFSNSWPNAHVRARL